MARDRTPLQRLLSEVWAEADDAPEEVAPADHAIIQQLTVARLIRQKAETLGNEADLVAGARAWLLGTVMGVPLLRIAPLEVQAIVEAARQLTEEGRLLPPPASGPAAADTR